MPYKDPEKAREQRKRWRAAHPEYTKAYHKKWTAENKEKLRDYRKKWVDKNPEWVKAINKKHHAKRYREFRKWVNEFKVKTGCKDCGYNKHAVALDFDHLEGKKFAISRMHQLGKEQVSIEMAKCEVVCANCHRVRTWITRKGLA